MNKKWSLRTKLTILTGTLLTFYLLLVLVIVNYHTLIRLDQLFIDLGAEEQIKIELDLNAFGQKIQWDTFLLTIFVILLGVGSLYVVIGMYLKSLIKLAQHMDHVPEGTIPQSIDMTVHDRENEVLRDSFNKMAEQLKDSFELQKNFSSHIAHELQTPLSVIKTKLDVFHKREHTVSEYEKLLWEIENRVLSLSDLIRQLLDFSTMEKVERTDVVPLHDLLEELIFDLEGRAKEKMVRFHLESEETSCQIYCNYPLIHRAFYNIIENAIKYNQTNGDVKILVRSDKTSVQVLIQDTGMGLQKEELEHVFDRFYRTKYAACERGYGLGLILSKKIFELHGYTLYAESQPGRGTVFQIQIPREKYETISR